MQNFSTEPEEKKESPAETSDALEMSVSPIFLVNGKKKACVSFTDKKRTAEGMIPECVITKNNGYSEEEIKALEDYMKKELKKLKQMAANVNVLKAFMKE